jgi:cytochrome b6-f complex iron-sulfur subunit
MSGNAVVAIAIAAAVVLAAIIFLTTARRSDVRGAGALSGETRKRDEFARRARERVEGEARAAAEGASAERPGTALAVLTAEEAERAGAEARRPTPVRATPTAPAPWTPPDPEAIGVSRRQFFNRANVTLMTASIGAFTVAGFVAFLWPSSTGGFGQVVTVGKVDEIREGARAGFGFFYAPSARTWFTEYPEEGLSQAQAIYDPPIFAGMRDHGLVALYQKCPHLGCRVPKCDTSRWFECPCHGSQYNQVGEKKGGPAPRGMDRFAFTVDGGGNVSVDTGTVIQGPPIGTNTTGQEAEGPHCITGGSEH